MLAEPNRGWRGFDSASPLDIRVSHEVCEPSLHRADDSFRKGGRSRHSGCARVQIESPLGLYDGYRVLVIQGDPHAATFDHACGAKQIGAKVSASIPGRMLPLLEIELA